MSSMTHDAEMLAVMICLNGSSTMVCNRACCHTQCPKIAYCMQGCTHVFTLLLLPLLAAGQHSMAQHRSPQWDLPAQRSLHHRLQGSGVPARLLQIHFSADPVELHTSRQTAIPLATGCPVHGFCALCQFYCFVLCHETQRNKMPAQQRCMAYTKVRPFD